MHWREWIQRYYADGKFQPPASEDTISEVEVALSVTVPAELRAVWQEANGIAIDGSPGRYGWRVWSAQEVIEENLELRSYSEQNDLYMTFDSMLCFAEDGGGSLLFFPIQANGRVNRPDIFMWDHETDSRIWVAGGLLRFVETRLVGTPPDPGA